MRALAAIFALSCSLLHAAPASAQQRATSPSSAPPSKDEATRLKREGDEAFLARRYVDALRDWEASLAIAPNPALHYNRARALEALERLPEALDAFERFMREAPSELREKTAKLDDHVRTLRQKVATIDLRVTPPGARITVRRVVVGTAPLKTPLRLNAGLAEVEVEAEGHEPVKKSLVFQGGTTQTIDFVLRARPAAVMAAPTAPEPAPVVVDDAPSVLSRWWFWAGAGAVVAGGVITVIVLTRPAEARSGDIGPGQLTAPLLRF